MRAPDPLDLLSSPHQVSVDLARRLRARRKERGLSQAVLAQRSGVSLASLKRFEHTGQISLTSLLKLAFALGYDGDFAQLFAEPAYTSIEDVIRGRRAR